MCSGLHLQAAEAVTPCCYHTLQSLLFITDQGWGAAGLTAADRRKTSHRGAHAHGERAMRRGHRRAPGASCRLHFSPSLQTSTLLCVKNLQAICGGCVLTCPGWAMWGAGGGGVEGWGGVAEEEARTAHSSPTKGAPLPGCTAKSNWALSHLWLQSLIPNISSEVAFFFLTWRPPSSRY